MKKVSIAVAMALLPLSTFAQQLGNISNLVDSASGIINKVIPILFTLALLGFFWGLVRFLFGGAEDKDQAKNIMIWGVVALAVMASVWGLVNFLGSAFNINKDAAPSVNPLIPKP